MYALLNLSIILSNYPIKSIIPLAINTIPKQNSNPLVTNLFLFTVQTIKLVIEQIAPSINQ